ncbi:hypothetical protein OC861_000447 [Tilletia horrida]|nr:hypothetical protein OC861_000447 [Tilletia horrida]
MGTQSQLSKRAKRKQSSSILPLGGLIGALVNFCLKIGLFYVVIGAVWQCSSRPFNFQYDSKDSRALCRQLYYAKPHITPHLQALNAQISPYVEPYYAHVRPYVHKAYSTAAPIASDLEKRSALAWKRYGEPKRVQAERAVRKWADPHVKRARKEWKKHTQPHIQNIDKHTKPYRDVYYRDVHPYMTDGYVMASEASTRTTKFYFAHIQPNILKATSQSYKFYKAHILPYLRRAYSLYVRPTVDKALAKVFQRQLGDARRAAVKEAQKAAEDARDASEKEAALKNATKESPSYVEQAKQAVFGKEDPEEALRIAKLDAELDAETARITSDLNAWEHQHIKLVQQQYRLVLQRVADLRNRALVDLPDRFALLSEDVVEGEVSSVLARLEQEFEKLASDLDVRSTSDKVADFEQATNREIESLQAVKETKTRELNDFALTLAAEEIDTANAAIKELDLFTVDAKRAFDALMEDAKFEATVEEFVSWDDELVIRSSVLRAEILDVLKGTRKPNLSIGALDLTAEPNLEEEVARLKQKTDKIFDKAIAEIKSYGSSAALQLRGQGVKKQIKEVTDSIADSASSISSDISEGLQDAIHAAKVKLHIEEDPSLLSSISKSASSASSAASKAADAIASGLGIKAEQAQSVFSATSKAASTAAATAASSANDALRNAGAAATDAAKSASSAARGAVRSAASAAGANIEPETPREYAESVAAAVSSGFASATNAAAEYAQGAAASASSVIHHATRSAASAVGASVTPESAEEHLDAVRARAGSVAAAAQSGAAEGVAAVQSGAAEAVANAGSLLHKATRSVASAVGASVTPESAEEHLDAVRARAGSVAAAAQSGAAEGVAAVQSGAAKAVANAGSLLHRATRSAASAAGASVTPESAADYLDIVRKQADDMFASIRDMGFSASEAGASAVSAAGSGIHAATRSVASAVGATPSPESASEYAQYAADKAGEAWANVAGYAAGAASQVSERAGSVAEGASSILHQATRSASSAVGATPTPETAGEYIEYVAQKAQGVYEGAVDGAASIAESAQSRLHSVAGGASSVVDQVTQSFASVAGKATDTPAHPAHDEL